MGLIILLCIPLVPTLIVFVWFLITVSKDKKKDLRFHHRHRIRYE